MKAASRKGPAFSLNETQKEILMTDFRNLLKSIGMPQDDKIAAPIIVGYPKSIPEIPARLNPQILKVIN